MISDNIIDFDEQRRRKAAASFDLDYDRLGDPTELEKAALMFFEAITDTLRDGADNDRVDGLIDRMDRMLDALDCCKARA